MTYTIVGFNYDELQEAVPAYVELYFSREQQSYIVSLRDGEGYEIGTNDYHTMYGGGKQHAQDAAIKLSELHNVPIKRCSGN